jgi:hypothetical protein
MRPSSRARLVIEALQRGKFGKILRAGIRRRGQARMQPLEIDIGEASKSSWRRREGAARPVDQIDVPPWGSPAIAACGASTKLARQYSAHGGLSRARNRSVPKLQY